MIIDKVKGFYFKPILLYFKLPELDMYLFARGMYFNPLWNTLLSYAFNQLQNHFNGYVNVSNSKACLGKQDTAIL